MNAVLDLSTPSLPNRDNSDAHHKGGNIVSQKSHCDRVSMFSNCSMVFMLVPSDEHYAAYEHQPFAQRTSYPMIPTTNCSASQLLTNFEESLAGAPLPDGDDPDERTDLSGTKGPQVVPIAVQGLSKSVLTLVAAYIVHFSGCAVRETTGAIGGEHVPAASKPPTAIPTPYPATSNTFMNGTPFEKDVFQRCDSDLSFCIGVMHAANFLGVAGLVQLASLSLALKLRGHSPKGFRKIFSECRIPLEQPVVDEYGDLRQ
jgi:hypothetical protein